MKEQGQKEGLIHVYSGDGKGKTTAALGLAMRACGQGLKVYMIQFMKGDINYGEIAASNWIPNFEIVQFGRASFVDKENPDDEDVELAKKALLHAEDVISSGKYDMVILDELNVAIDFKLVSLEEVINLLKTKPKNVEVVITGRSAHDKIMEIADYVTRMDKIKHPYDSGFQARDGIEH
jgi:cob(I)alamin adenosyltransferase